MRDFEILRADTELNDLLSSINEAHTEVYSTCHGSYHANFVACRAGTILADLHFDNRTVEVGKIAGLLHDIGCISGKDNHAMKSSQMCEKFLCKTNLTSIEKDVIIQAIVDHSDGNDIKSVVGAALLIADKTDLSKERILDHTDLNNYHKNLLEVENVDVSIQGSEMIINFVASEKFSVIVVHELWSKAFYIPAKAAKYLGCAAVFMVNGLRTNGLMKGSTKR